MRIYRRYIERITIIGPNEDARNDVRRAFDYCTKHGYRVTWSGPKPIANGRYDMTKYKIVAERESNAH